MISRAALKRLRVRELRDIASTFANPVGMSKTELVDMLTEHYYRLRKFIGYTYVKQLGKGLHGRVFLAKTDKQEFVAVKLFHENVSAGSIARQVHFQQLAAEHGISPGIVDWCAEGKFIAMRQMEGDLLGHLRLKNGKLSANVQKKLVRVFEELDRIHIFHADSNLGNFMFDKQGNWAIVDFGLSKNITNSMQVQYGRSPNSWWGVQSLCKKLAQLYPSACYRVLDECVERHRTAVTTPGASGKTGI